MKMGDTEPTAQLSEIEDRELTAQLDEEERELLESYERGEWVPIADKEAVVVRLKVAAANTLRKDRRVNIRITGKDLEALQALALEEGIPYQTLMSSILHKYVTGRLIERPRTIPGQTVYALHEEGDEYQD
jgi:predicted DNA binding CopG/RHH family protein